MPLSTTSSPLSGRADVPSWETGVIEIYFDENCCRSIYYGHIIE